ncbi:MAG: alpha-galactosidase [Clostridia bacterium]|nr:alpha-galactosidase [Clostridia bacterium]
MKKQELFFNITGGDGVECRLSSVKDKGEIKIYNFDLEWNESASVNNAEVKLEWCVTMLEFMYRWSPLCGSNRNITPDWAGRRSSMLSVNAPTESIYNGQGSNRYTYAVSECAKKIDFGTGVVEENGSLHFMVRTNLKQYAPGLKTNFSIYIDTRDIPVYESVWDVAEWWAKECGMTPAEVPDAAFEPVYSFWYSYHQHLNAHEVEAECKRAKELGFDVCIVDDGWQTDDLNRGYAFCGDWEPAVSKMGDMAEHVERVHEIGMKYILWYSVPYIGCKSKNFDEFKDMILRDPHDNVAVFDPRYKKVREYLKGIYVKALNDWKLDGFKLDFIDMWGDRDANRPYNDKMDIPVLQDAVDAFMTDVISTLKAIKPDILLEFRQCYIGPNMRKYGNMFRVGDCPNDYINNRVGVLDLRTHLGDSAVHSDMLMWHPKERPEIAAIQIINIIFGVMQYSARLDSLTPEMKKMSRFWLDFMKKHKDLLLKSPVHTFDLQNLYTWAKTTRENECMIALFAADKCVKPDDVGVIYVANGCQSERALVECDGKYCVKIQNCFGDIISEEQSELCGINAISVPVGGLITLTKI